MARESAGADRRGVIEGEPWVLAADLAIVPMVGWAAGDSGVEGLITLEPVALVIAQPRGVSRFDLADVDGYPNPATPGTPADRLTEAVRGACVAVVFGERHLADGVGRMVLYGVTARVETDAVRPSDRRGVPHRGVVTVEKRVPMGSIAVRLVDATVSFVLPGGVAKI